MKKLVIALVAASTILVGCSNEEPTVSYEQFSVAFDSAWSMFGPGAKLGNCQEVQLNTANFIASYQEGFEMASGGLHVSEEHIIRKMYEVCPCHATIRVADPKGVTMFISNITFHHCCYCNPQACSPAVPIGTCSLHECELILGIS